MISRKTQASPRIACLALLAGIAAIGGAVAHDERRNGASCTITSRSTTEIVSAPGYATALVQLAGVACNDVGAGTVQINTNVSRVASVMAEAVAEVVAECTGQGNSVVTTAGFANAAATAEAVGNASARIVVTSEVCELCTAGLVSFVSAVETVAVTAVAEASSMADFMFQEGIEETLTARDIQRTVEQVIIDVLASAIGTIRSDPDGCSAVPYVPPIPGEMVACDFEVSAGDIFTELEAVATAGAAVRALACEGGNITPQVNTLSREVATAVARAIVHVESFCESTGGPGTMGCGLGNGTVTAIVRATAAAFAYGLVEQGGDSCFCDLSAVVDAKDVVEIIAASITSAMATACTEGANSTTASDFQIEVEEVTAVSVAEFIAFTVAGSGCGHGDPVIACAECVGRNQQCAGPGVEQMSSCCNANNVCASLFGRETFQCRSRAMLDAFESAGELAEVLECYQPH